MKEANAEIKIKVSIIVPVYNAEAYLQEALDSAIKQTIEDIEILCVNDGSTDHSLDLLRDYASRDHRIIVMSQANQGAASARNNALLKARGKYVAFLDPDDFYPAEDVLEKLYRGAEDHDCQVAGGSLLILQQDGTVTNSPECLFSTQGILQYRACQFDFNYQRFLFKRKMLLDNHIFFPNYRRYQDPPFFVKAMCVATQFYALPDPVYCYRQGGVNVIDWRADNCRRLIDFINGLYDELQLAIEYDLQILQKNMIHRVFEKSFYFKLFEQGWQDENVKTAIDRLMHLFASICRDTVVEKLAYTPIDFPENELIVAPPQEMTEVGTVKVSVIVPVYNVENYLAECLDSLLNQTLKEIEIICVDDCSPDNSAQIMRNYAERDKRIKNIFLTQNGGLSHARNQAMKQMKGKYVFFLDSDDMLELEALEKLYNVAEANNAEHLSFLPSILKEIPDSTLGKTYVPYPKRLVNRVYSGAYLLKRLLDTSHFLPSACFKFVKCSLLKQYDITFVEGFIHEDWYFSPKTMNLATRAILLNERLYIRRVREGSIMTSGDDGANMRHVLGYAVDVGMLQKEIRNGTYSELQKKNLHRCCICCLKLILLVETLNSEFLKEVQKQLAPCNCDENWDFLFAIVDEWRNSEKIARRKASKQKHAGILQKLRAGFRCLKDKGFLYTCKRVLQKIRKKSANKNGL